MIFHFQDAPARNQRDVQRRRTIVSISPRTNPEATLHLGTVWRSRATGRWYFTWEERTLRRLATPEGYATRDDAAIALFEDRMRTARSKTLGALAIWNALRRHSQQPRMVLQRGERLANRPIAGEEEGATLETHALASTPSGGSDRDEQ